MAKGKKILLEETIGDTTIKLVKDGDLYSLFRNEEVVTTTDWKDAAWYMYSELVLSLYREYHSKKNNA